MPVFGKGLIKFPQGMGELTDLVAQLSRLCYEPMLDGPSVEIRLTLDRWTDLISPRRTASRSCNQGGPSPLPHAKGSIFHIDDSNQSIIRCRRLLHFFPHCMASSTAKSHHIHAIDPIV